MTKRPTRRTFLGTTLFSAAVIRTPCTRAESAPRPRLDLHAHLFGTGDSGSGCRLSKAITDGLQFRSLKFLLGIEKKGKTLDEGYEAALLEQIAGSGMTKVAILAQDAVYDRRGEPDWGRTNFYVPNDYVFRVAGRHTGHLIPCPNINPQRKDALDELERIHEKGARLFKIHPPTQSVDVSDPKHVRFFRRCAELKILVLVHTGHEHSAPVRKEDIDLANPRRLERALDQGARVVACHGGTGWPTDTPDQLPFFLNLLKRYPNLWGDTAVLGTPGRVRDFYRLLDDPLARARLLHGSDFPFPVGPAAFAERVPAETLKEIGREANWIKKDWLLKDALGVGAASAERAYELVLGESS